MSRTVAFPGTRLQVARMVAEQPMTLYEIATGLGRTSGSLSGLVHRMVEEDWLQSDPDPPVRGSQFRLKPEHLERLELELADGARPGSLVAHQPVLLLDGDDRRALYEVIARPALAGCVSWVADFDGAGSRLIALQEGADDFDVERLTWALQDAGLTVRTGRIGNLVEGDAVRRFAAGTAASSRRLKAIR